MIEYDPPIDKISSTSQHMLEAQTASSAEWQRLHDEIPPRLYHYTTLDGMKGIVESRCVWLSDARFMNDSSELKYANAIINDEAKNVIDESHLAELLAKAHQASEGAEDSRGTRPFIACFCAVDDLLSQWRGYGANDASVSLGLSLTPEILSSLPAGVRLRKVIYDEATQRSLVRRAVTVWARAAEDLAARDELYPIVSLMSFQNAIHEFRSCFKHPTFVEEQEWRLIRMVAPNLAVHFAGSMLERLDEVPALKFRRSPYGFTPYVELSLGIDSPGTAGTGVVPLWTVTQGPRAHSEIALESLELYFESQGFGHTTKTKASAVPLRR